VPPPPAIPPLRTLAAAPSRAAALAAVWIENARSSLGIRRGFRAEGVYYKELTAERLGPALAARRHAGPGSKDYRATFADGSKMLIRCSRSRCYADLMGPEGIDRYTRIAPILRPGSRVIDVACPPMTTGYCAAWLARMVGPSGAVVSVIDDDEGARFAPKRYALSNLSFERGPIAGALVGETDGAFDAVICLGLPRDDDQQAAHLKELWRIVRHGGWMLAGLSPSPNTIPGEPGTLREELSRLGSLIQPADGAGRTTSEFVVTKPVPADEDAA